MSGAHGNASSRANEAGRKLWGEDWRPRLASRAPGRLELLGNHIDYNGGPVLAAAIDRDVVCLLSESADTGVCVTFPDIEHGQTRLIVSELRNWTNHAGALTPVDYVRGVIATALAAGVEIRDGVSLSIAGDVPIGFGLSSSAALCIALSQVLHVPSPVGRDLVLRAQEAEHRAGTPCGTMDQSASVGGDVILFDGATVTWKSIVPDLNGHLFAVANSGVSRSLAVSSYGKRVEESKQGLHDANRLLGTTHANLAELDLAELEEIESSNEIDRAILKRIRHIVTETERVQRGIQAVGSGDWVAFGHLMSESGRSSAADYEISHPDVEKLVRLAETVPGVLGARMMGGGEGGTALILLHETSLESLRNHLGETYFDSRGLSSETALQALTFAQGASVAAIS